MTLLYTPPDQLQGEVVNYTHAMGLKAAEASSYAYCPPPDVGIIYSSDSWLQATYTQEWISFRGSSNLENWLTDLDATRTDFKGTKVHTGFLTAWNYLRDQVLTNNYKHNLLVTGHSLGGAIAQLASLDLAELGYNVTLISLGSPRVGNEQFAALLNKYVPTVYRITHYRDPIVHVPYVFMGFIHAGTEVFYQDLNYFQMCDSPTETVYCGANTVIPLPSVKQHTDYLIPAISSCLHPAESLFLE